MSKYRVEYDADMEEPKCDRCCNADGDCDCSEFCGPEHGWSGYRRYEWVETKGV